MASLTKGTLKKMLRECLKEILEEEGFSLVQEGRAAPVASPTMPTQASANNNKPPVENQLLKEHVNSLANSIGQTNPEQQDIFASIFADTAQNTLQEQVEPGMGGGWAAKPATPEVIAEEVKQLEGLSLDGDIGRWAQVALGGRSKK